MTTYDFIVQIPGSGVNFVFGITFPGTFATEPDYAAYITSLGWTILYAIEQDGVPDNYVFHVADSFGHTATFSQTIPSVGIPSLQSYVATLAANGFFISSVTVTFGTGAPPSPPTPPEPTPDPVTSVPAYTQDTPPHYRGETFKNLFRLLGFDLTSATVTVKISKPSGAVVTKTCTVIDAPTGQVMWMTDGMGSDFDEVGEYVEQHIIQIGLARRTGPMDTFYVNELLLAPDA